MTIKIVTVGNEPKAEIAKLINNYTRRLPANCKLNWHYIKHDKSGGTQSVEKESSLILKAISPGSTVLLLDETGQSVTSPELSRLIFNDSRDVTIIIGGAYGVNSQVMQKASRTIAIGKMVFPHQIVRLLLAEQIYRSYAISTGHPYHHS